MNERDQTPNEVFNQIIREQLNTECTVIGRLDRLERLVSEILIRLGKLEVEA